MVIYLPLHRKCYRAADTLRECVRVINLLSTVSWPRKVEEWQCNGRKPPELQISTKRYYYLNSLQEM